MLWLLFNNQELCVCDIVETLDITQSKASRHLATLRHAGLVTDRKVGAWSYYSLRPVENELARVQLDALRASMATHAGAAAVLAALKTWLRDKKRRSCVADGGSRTAQRRGLVQEAR
jgi:ArsR family transcriptional regulator, arsenate/arsenite/antimonite-responsive transcriptional repressor